MKKSIFIFGSLCVISLFVLSCEPRDYISVLDSIAEDEYGSTTTLPSSTTTTVDPRKDDNDTIATADLLLVSESKTDSLIKDLDDRDYFYFESSAAGNYVIEVNASDSLISGADFSLFIITDYATETGNVIDEHGSYGEGESTTVDLAADEVVYFYVVADEFEDYDELPYEVKVY